MRGAGDGARLGPRALFDAVEPALARMTARVVYRGERADLAATYKLCGNAIIIGLSAVLADVLTVAAGAEVAAPDALAVLDYLAVLARDAIAQRA